MMDQREGPAEDVRGELPASEADEPLFAGTSPRWREVASDRENEKDRRAHDRAARPAEREGAMERDEA